MKKPEKMVGRMFDGDGAWEEGYNQACDDWEKYHEWYIKTHCIKKEDLPTAEEILEILHNSVIDLEHPYAVVYPCSKAWMKAKAQALAKRIGKERG